MVINHTPPPDTEYLDIEGLATHLSVCKRTISKWRSGGRLPEPDIACGKIIRWKRSTVDGWIADGQLRARRGRRGR